jgi:prepilin-type N-terminal cleavage/methylation domain-containing protein
MSNQNIKKGFTLIEIVIVLAIAALIMVVVFFAVAGAQRGQRNDARKQAGSRALAASNSFQGNNNGDFPNDGAAEVNTTDLDDYLPDEERRVGSTTMEIDIVAALGSGTCNPTADATGRDIQLASVNGRPAVAVCTENAGDGTDGTWTTISE